MVSNIVVIGTQWGDEGKGKIVDILTKRVSAVVRYQGGHNAGHTLIIGGQKTVLRLIPSGIFHSGVRCYLGNGVVIAPNAFRDEVEELKSKQIALDNRLFVSPLAAVVMPYHIALDKAVEHAKGKSAIGTTGRGIGPCYEDKAARRAIRVCDLMDPDGLAGKLETVLEYHNFVLGQFYKQPTISFQQILDETRAYAEFLKPFVIDVPQRLAEHQQNNESILFEGAQGFYLDLDHGTYPFVTSSNTCVAQAATGSGFGPRSLHQIVGVTKAYTTRVGSGPFITELTDRLGAEMAERGHEFGSVTGRPRRCGWLDMVLLKRAIVCNSISTLALTKLDVLDTFSEIKLCIGYRLGNQTLNQPPISVDQWTLCEPIYESLPGWEVSTEGIRTFSALPEKAQQFIQRVEALAGVPISIISTGPDREDTICLEEQ